MSTPDPRTHPPPAPGHDVAALTCKTKEGAPYKRFGDVETEIGRCLAVAPSSWSMGSLKSQTLVHLIRRARIDGDQSTFGRLVDLIARRISWIAESLVQGFDPTTAEEIVIQVGQDVLELILSDRPTRQSEYLEVAFDDAVKKRTLNQVEKYKDRPRLVQFATREDDSDAASNRTMPTIEGVDSGEATPEEIFLDAETRALAPERIRIGLTAITDERHRAAVILRYLEEWPITDKDLTKPTLCNHFGISDRQIRTWIEVAFGQMRYAIGEMP